MHLVQQEIVIPHGVGGLFRMECSARPAWLPKENYILYRFSMRIKRRSKSFARLLS